MNAFVEGFEVDCVWTTQRLVVELDSGRFHLTRTAFERDRERDRILATAGWRVVRVTWRQLTRDPTRLANDLRKLLASPPALR
jgi:very-short-patch-repair endonuclease